MSDNSYLMAEIEDRLTRIAVALEVIASDITERKERERAALVSQYRHLVVANDRACDRFSSADRAIERALDVAGAKAYANECEREMIASGDALDTFVAANPGIEEMVGDVS